MIWILLRYYEYANPAIMPLYPTIKAAILIAFLIAEKADAGDTV